MKSIQTAMATGHQARVDSLTWKQGKLLEKTTINLKPDITRQEYFGIGGAFTESAAYNFSLLPKVRQHAFLTHYFDPDQGSGYQLGRIHMNSCDFSLDNWACQETEESIFSLEHYQEHIFPMIRAAEQVAGHKIPLLVSPWSPPAWMKTNGEMNHGGQLKPEFRDEWANYFIQFIQGLLQEGFEVWGLTIQNEPAAKQVWDSCLYSPEQERDFIKFHLGPALEQAGLSNIRVICWDHNRDELFLRANCILSDPDAAKYTWGSGFHWYVDPCFDNVARVKEAFPDHYLVFTEGCQEGGPHHGSWKVAERYGESMIQDFRNGASAWIDWNLLLNFQGGPNHVQNLCSAPILLNESSDDFTLQPSYAYLGHFSRYLKPGSRTILSASSREALEQVAFEQPDGSLVVVVMNRSEQSIEYQLVCEQQLIQHSIEARAIQTLLLKRP